jgi:hypothetical protein
MSYLKWLVLYVHHRFLGGEHVRDAEYDHCIKCGDLL